MPDPNGIAGPESQSRLRHSPIPPGIVLGLEVFCFAIKRILLGHPSPPVHDHLEFDVARDRARPLHRAAAKFAFVIIFDGANVHLLGQERHAQNPFVWVDGHIASRLFADRVEAKFLTRDEAY